MDLLLGVAPKPAPAASAAAPATASGSTELAAVSAEPADGQTPAILLEETGELLPAESTAAELPAPILTEQEPSEGEVIAAEAPVDEVVATVATAEPLATAEPAPKTRRRRSSAPTPTSAGAGQPAAATPEAGTVVETGAAPPAKTAGRRRRDPDEDLEPAYIPIKVTVSIPAVVLSELIRTVQTIRRMTGRRQPVNQGTVIAAALEMAFEEFRTKGATSQLVDKLRIE